MKIRIKRILIPALSCLAVACLIEVPLGETTMFGDAVILWDSLFRAVISVPLLLMFYREDRVFRGKERWGAVQMAAVAAAGAFFSLCFGFLTVVLRLPGYETAKGVLFTGPLWLQLLVMLLASPLLEELFFRGVLYQRLKELVNPRLSGIITAVLFGLFHGNPAQGVYGFFMGLLLAYAMEKCQTVKAPVILHGAANAAAMLAPVFFSAAVP